MNPVIMSFLISAEYCKVINFTVGFSQRIEVLTNGGFSPNIVTKVPSDEADTPLAKANGNRF